MKRIKDWYKKRAILGDKMFLLECVRSLTPIVLLIGFWVTGYDSLLRGLLGWLIVASFYEIKLGGYYTGDYRGFEEGLGIGFEDLLRHFKDEHQPKFTRNVHKS